ncbi:MAG: hypothetical protein ACI9WS_000376, partial [Paraglaciecola psychrophila]
MKIFKVFVLAVFMVVALTQTVAPGVILNSVTFTYRDTSFIRLYFDGVTERFAPFHLTHVDVVADAHYSESETPNDIIRVDPGWYDGPQPFRANFYTLYHFSPQDVWSVEFLRPTRLGQLRADLDH